MDNGEPSSSEAFSGMEIFWWCAWVQCQHCFIWLPYWLGWLMEHTGHSWSPHPQNCLVWSILGPSTTPSGLTLTLSKTQLCPRRCNDLWFLPILLWSFGSLSSYMDAILFHLVLIWVYGCSISATVGSYLLSVKLAGYIYDRQLATIQAAALATGKILTGPQKCIGPQCFRSAGLCLAWVFREHHCNHQKCWVDKVRWAKTGCTISSKVMESSSKLSCNELKQTKTI
jgi:hypothetical protein